MSRVGTTFKIPKCQDAICMITCFSRKKIRTQTCSKYEESEENWKGNYQIVFSPRVKDMAQET